MRALGFLQDRQHLVGSVWLLLAWLHVLPALQWSDSRRIGVVGLLNLFPPGERPRRGLPQAGAGVPCSPNLRLIRAKPSFCFPAGEAGGCAGPSLGAVVLEGDVGKWGGSLCPSWVLPFTKTPPLALPSSGCNGAHVYSWPASVPLRLSVLQMISPSRQKLGHQRCPDKYWFIYTFFFF